MKLLFLCAATALATQDRAPTIELNLATKHFGDHKATAGWKYPGEDAAHPHGEWYGDYSANKPRARRCTAKSSDASTCAEPQCRAWDWHDKDRAGQMNSGEKLQCETTYTLVNVDNLAQKSLGVHQDGLDWDLRSEWLITYNAVDRAGNAATEAAFTMIMDDRVKPGEGRGKGCTGGVCDFIIPFNHNKGVDKIESVEDNRRWKQLHHVHLFQNKDSSKEQDRRQVAQIKGQKAGLLHIEDNYDGTDVEKTLKLTIEYPGINDSTTGKGCKKQTKTFDVGGTSTAVSIDSRCLGDYKITYTVNDFAGMYGVNGENNVASRSGWFRVVDTTKPVITVQGTHNYVHECNTAYNDAKWFHDASIDAGALCHDVRDSWAAEDGAPRNDRPKATWSPNAGNPAVLLLHTNPTQVNKAEAINGVVCSSVTSITDSLWGSKHAAKPNHNHYDASTFKGCDSSAKASANTITYNCVDAVGLAAKTEYRKVTVVDTRAPTLRITTVGKELINRYCDSSKGCGLHAKKNGKYEHNGQELTAKQLAKQASYTEHYTIEHTAGYADDDKFIAMLEEDGIGFHCEDDCGTWTAPKNEGGTYLAPETRTVTTWHQGCECPCTNSPATSFNTDKPGTYVLRYTCTDSHNNPTTKCRTVVNEDKFKPVLTILGADEMTLEATTEGNYVDDGATCSDNVDGLIPANVEVSGDVVKLANIGEYLVQYNCRDAAGNQAEPLTRKVVVKQSWGAVTAKLDLPKVHNRAEFEANEDKQFAIRTAMAKKADVDVAAVKLEVYEWQGVDYPDGGSCNKILGRRLFEAAPTTTQQGSIGLKLIVAVPNDTKAKDVESRISANNFACNLIKAANDELDAIANEQASACGSMSGDAAACNAYTAVQCAHSANQCTPNYSNVVKHLTHLTCDNSCNAAQTQDACNAHKTGCFFPAGHGCCWNAGKCRNFGCKCRNSKEKGSVAAARPTGIGCQNSITCQVKGDNPVTWEAGFQYSDAGAECSDSIDGTLSVDEEGVDSVNVNETGTYYVTYKSKNTQDTYNFAWDKDCCASRRTVYVTDTLKPVIRITYKGTEVGRSSGASTAWRQPNGKNHVHPNPTHLDATKPWTTAHENIMSTKIDTASHMMAEVAGSSSAWVLAAVVAAVAGVALLAQSRKQEQVIVPV